MLEQFLGQQQKMRQEQILAPAMVQSLEMLTLPLVEIEQRINAELANNPTLELMDGGIRQAVGNPVEEYQPAVPDDPSVRDDDDSGRLQVRREMLENLMYLDEQNRGISRAMNPLEHSANQDDAERHQYFWDSLVSEPSLDDMLQEQLDQTSGLSRKQRRICTEIIGSIDHTGYLRSHLADIAISCQCSLKEVEKALAVIHQFDPPGVGARNLKECLLLQLQNNGRHRSPAWKIVSQHLDDLGRNRLQQIAEAMKLEMPELQKAVAEIRRLRPYPGSHISPVKPTEFVVPEIFVEIDDQGQPQITANREYAPRLRLSGHYLKMLQDPNLPEEDKAYIREKITNSKQLLRMLEQRESTLLRIARSLVQFQLPFFTESIDRLQPLTMQRVAQDIGLHETTVSRAVNHKFMMTPYGLLPFRFFFAAGHLKENGESVSNQIVKQAIQEIVANEDRQSPLSDNDILKKLMKQGYQLARRTVAKYREELGIAAAPLRKRF